MSGQLEFGEEDRTPTLTRAWELAMHLLAGKVNPCRFLLFHPAYSAAYLCRQRCHARHRQCVFPRTAGKESSKRDSQRAGISFRHHWYPDRLRCSCRAISSGLRKPSAPKPARGKIKPGQTALSLDVEPAAENPNPSFPRTNLCRKREPRRGCAAIFQNACSRSLLLPSVMCRRLPVKPASSGPE